MSWEDATKFFMENAFLDRLPATGRFAFEFRHSSWQAARGLVTDRGHGWCLSDSDDQPAKDDD